VTATTLDKREERIRSMFAAIAPRYDLLNHLLSANVDLWWRHRTTQLAPPDLRDPAPILDVCCGTGDLSLAYDRAARGKLPIIGTDFCMPMLESAARKAARRRASSRIQLIEADTQRLPFPDGTFQLVTVAFGLRNVTDTSKGLREMVRVCKPGGRVVILEFSRPRGWLFGSLYNFYFRSILPRIGQWVSRSKHDAYNYLPASVLEFPDGDDLAGILRGHGLDQVRYHPMTFGIATLYIGVKPRHG
jgi:demethylmenaquinone methyltransferase/2-methoxy-6-polyprenyl-1,4-benzoquinol methylase